MILLTVENARKGFALGKGRQMLAVDDVSFSIATGEAVGLVGESGSGKSTVSRLIAGLTPLDAGTILIGGKTPAEAQGATQLVFQNAEEALNPAFTVARNIAVGLGLSRGGASEAVRQAAQAVGLTAEFLARRPHQLSGGQQARAGIARALVGQPQLLLMDEPTAALDVSVQAMVLKLIDRLRREAGFAMLFVSHDLDVVRLICDRVLVMYRGRVVEEGPVAAVTRTPRHPYTRALFDAMPARGGSATIAVPQATAEPRADACNFRDRCPLARPVCATSRPALAALDGSRRVACHALQ